MAGRSRLPALRILLIGAAAVAAYLLLSALDSGPALADDGEARGRIGAGLSVTILERARESVPVAGTTRDRPPAARAGILPRVVPGAGAESPSRPTLPPSVTPGRRDTGGPAAVPVPARDAEIRERVAAIVDRTGSDRRLPLPPAPGDVVGPDRTDTLPDLVPGGIDPIETVPAVVGAVPEVIATVPAVVEVVPAVVGAVPDLVATVPAVVGLVPRTVPDVVQVIPAVIDALPRVTEPIAPLLPLFPPAPSGTLVMMPPPAGPAIAPAVPATATTPVVADTASLAATRQHRSAGHVTSVRSAAGVIGGPAPGDPPRNKPLAGAQQASGVGSTSGQAHAVPATSAAGAGYHGLFTRLAGDTDGAGVAPAVPALPG